MIAGIDPGLTGGIAIYNGKRLSVFDIPTYRAKSKNWINIPALIKIMSKIPSGSTIVIEDVHSMPNQGISSAFKFGRGFGILLGVATFLKLDIVLVSPSKWKKDLDLNKKDKHASVALANKLFKAEIPKSKNGRAEASLLVYWFMEKKEKK